ncbi:MAG TPA: CIA30 family protein [Phycisphaerae bacterium]|nr:CIA30 family protein [Phycisphaerae bacterium]
MTRIPSHTGRIAAIGIALLGSFAIGLAAEPKGKLLTDFSDPDAAKSWVSVNDDVMGGVSDGSFRISEEKTLVFSGKLSLENRGGFASIQSRQAEMNLSGYETIAVRVKGDGRTYYLNLSTSSRRSAASYRAAMKTTADAWQEVRVPLRDFKYTAFGQRIGDRSPEASSIRSVGFTLADKKAGPFRLEVASIKAEKSAETAGSDTDVKTDSTAGSKDIVDIAASTESFKTLVAAVSKAGLVETLKGPGPFTVFAPTDEAFAELPEGTLESLLKPENKAKLIETLKFHVVSGRLTAADVRKLPAADTVQGTSLLFAQGPIGVTVDGASVVQADILATNGVIHVIDRVLLPKDIVETAARAGNFKTLLTAVKAAGLVDALERPDANLTVFAPTDNAFEKLPAGTVEDLLRPANRDRLTAILKYHVLPTRLLLTQDGLKTLQGDTIQIRPLGEVRVEQANIVVTDIKATNGVIHVIDSVLIPALPEPTARRKAMSVIELAIERGVPLFNAGKTDACAAIYEITAKSLLDGHRDALTEQDRARLKRALAAMHNDHGSLAQAWTLRYALDGVYRALRSRE